MFLSKHVMRRIWLVAALASIAFGAFPAVGFACSCVGPTPACKAYWDTDVIMDASVISIESLAREDVLGGRMVSFPEKVVRLQVSRAWKGVDAGQIEVVTASEGSACGFDFRVGERYLVFAHRRQSDGRLGVSSCSKTTLFDRAADAMGFLDSLAQPSTGGRVFGSVRAFMQMPGAAPIVRPLETTIRLSGAGTERSATSASGKYEFRDLAPGMYAISMTVPEGYTAYGDVRTVEIRNARACAEEDFAVSPGGRIFGRLLNAAGRPAAGVSVDIAPASALESDDAPGQSAIVGVDGAFLFERVAPGRYIIGVNLRDEVTDRSPYPRNVYPGGPGGPETIDVALGQTVQLPDWRLPAPQTRITVAGWVSWENGDAAIGVIVQPWDTTSRTGTRRRPLGAATTDATGMFTLPLREGHHYTFTVVSPDRRERFALDPLEIVAGADGPAPRIRIRRGRPQ